MHHYNLYTRTSCFVAVIKDPWRHDAFSQVETSHTNRGLNPFVVRLWRPSVGVNARHVDRSHLAPWGSQVLETPTERYTVCSLQGDNDNGAHVQ